jgi:hypothetical protein
MKRIESLAGTLIVPIQSNAKRDALLNQGSKQDGHVSYSSHLFQRVEMDSVDHL